MQGVLKWVQKKIPAYNLPKAVLLMDCLQEDSHFTYTKVDAQPNDVALLQYTGGTTGIAKGVMLTHRNLAANILQTREVVRDDLHDEQEVIISPLPLYHVYSFTVSFMLMLYSGNHTVLITNPRDLPGFVKELKKYPFSVFVGLNTLFLGLCELAEFKTVNFSKLKITLSGGMALQRSVADGWKKITKCEIREGYGLSETSPVVSFNPRKDNQAGSIGLPVASTVLKVIDDDGKELAIGEPGELCVQGPQVMPGYWQRDDETIKVLDSEGWLKTGDIAVIQPDGFIKIVDRKKDMIIVSGFKVFPNQIEDVMMHHPGIKQCAAIGVPDPHSGEVIKLFIVRKDKNLTEKDVLDYCHEQFTGYKRPKQVEFRDSLPMSNVGKILRKELRNPVKNG
jgi:long-chain acyl-CoA synthetase